MKGPEPNLPEVCLRLGMRMHAVFDVPACWAWIALSVPFFVQVSWLLPEESDLGEATSGL